MWRQIGRTAAALCVSASMLTSAVLYLTGADAKTPSDRSRIDALVAPIALYPDRLLAKVLVASTYPLEIAEAGEWLQQNARSSESALVGKLEKQRWDASIKDLVRVPRLIVMMNDHLDWTQTLGDAFLTRPEAVTDSVQAVRAKAASSGFLVSNNFQNVIHATHGIEIRAVSTEILYLPYYDPDVLYAASKPSTRPQPSWVAPPGHWYERKVSFLPGVVVPPTLWNTSLNWDEHYIYLEPPASRGKQGDSALAPDRVSWQHDPTHRRGVTYASAALRARYGGQWAAGPPAQRALRGFADGPKQAPHFSRHGGALDGMGDGAEINVFSRRGHRSLSDDGGSSNLESRGTLQP